jgi:hypothetical protein
MDRSLKNFAGLGLIAALALAGCQKAAPPAANTASASNAAGNTATAPDTNAAQAAPTGDAADVKAYLDGLYAHYKSSKNNTFQMFDKDEKQVFDADMIALLAEDGRLLKGELGAIDGDWLCDCQDFESLKTTVAVQSATPTTAKASADFIDVGMPGQEARHADFDLVKTPAGWRIHDITTKGEPSLRKTLTDEIQTLKHPGAKKAASDEAP